MTFSTLTLLRSLALAGLAATAVSCVSRPPYPVDGNVFIKDGPPKYGWQGTNSPQNPAPSNKPPKTTGEDPSKLHDGNTTTTDTPPPTTDTTTPPPTDTPPTTGGGEDVKAKPNPSASLPFGTPVIGEKGYVYSPYAPDKGKVDVKDIPSNTKVECPYTGKIFRVP